MSKQYIIVYDDDAVTSVYGEDEECEGALELACGSEEILLFDSHAAAQTAIRISIHYNRLLKAQGKIYNEDFTDCLKNVKIRPVKEYVIPTR